MMMLKNYVSIITGASRGIGKGIAKEFALNGANVIIADIDIDEGKQVVKEINEKGGKAIFIETDVTSEEDVKSMVNQVYEQYGKIDTLINNAGITLFKPLIETSLEDWNKVIDTDLRGVFLCSKYVAEKMIINQSGSIINISSNHAFATLPNSELYAAAKAGVIGFTKSLALSLGDKNIRVNSVCPGFTDTSHYQKWLESYPDPKLVEEEVISLHATKRINSPSDVAKLCVYLASDYSNQITGTEIIIDGGVSSRLYHSEIC